MRLTKEEIRLTRIEMIRMVNVLASLIHRDYVAISEGGKPDQDCEWLSHELTKLVIKLERRPKPE